MLVVSSEPPSVFPAFHESPRHISENVNEMIVHGDGITVLAAKFVDSNLTDISPDTKDIRIMLSSNDRHKTSWTVLQRQSFFDAYLS